MLYIASVFWLCFREWWKKEEWIDFEDTWIPLEWWNGKLRILRVTVIATFITSLCHKILTIFQTSKHLFYISFIFLTNDAFFHSFNNSLNFEKKTIHSKNHSFQIIWNGQLQCFYKRTLMTFWSSLLKRGKQGKLKHILLIILNLYDLSRALRLPQY